MINGRDQLKETFGACMGNLCGLDPVMRTAQAGTGKPPWNYSLGFAHSPSILASGPARCILIEGPNYPQNSPLCLFLTIIDGSVLRKSMVRLPRLAVVAARVLVPARLPNRALFRDEGTLALHGGGGFAIPISGYSTESPLLRLDGWQVSSQLRIRTSRRGRLVATTVERILWT